MELVTKFLSFVLSKLPQSPFVSFINALGDLLELVKPGLLRLVCFISIQ